MNKIGKYEFTNESTAKSKIAALGTATDDNGNIYPTHKHCVVELGNITITPGDYDEEGNEVEAPINSVMYHVDVLWKGLEPVDAEGFAKLKASKVPLLQTLADVSVPLSTPSIHIE